MLLQKLSLLVFSPFFLDSFHTCSVLSKPLASSIKAHFITEASGSLGVIYFLPVSEVLFAKPIGAVDIHPPSFFAHRIPIISSGICSPTKSKTS